MSAFPPSNLTHRLLPEPRRSLPRCHRSPGAFAALFPSQAARLDESSAALALGLLSSPRRGTHTLGPLRFGSRSRSPNCWTDPIIRFLADKSDAYSPGERDRSQVPAERNSVLPNLFFVFLFFPFLRPHLVKLVTYPDATMVVVTSCQSLVERAGGELHVL